MQRLRQAEDGTLFVPRRGSPPTPPDGYEQMPGDPFTFGIKLDSCDYREVRIIKSGCCGEYKSTYCNKFGKFVSKLACKSCLEKGENDAP